MYKKLLGLCLSVFSSGVLAEPVKAPTQTTCPAPLDFTLRLLGSAEEVNLCEAYKGKLVIIVNTASKCGFTPQFSGLEQLYQQYQQRGLVILGFPSNDFANQDPDTEANIKAFCELTYGVKFPMFEKTHAAQESASPIYQVLGEMAGEYPRWNFHKYVLNPQGELIASFSSFVSPQSAKLLQLIEDNLPQE